MKGSICAPDRPNTAMASAVRSVWFVVRFMPSATSRRTSPTGRNSPSVSVTEMPRASNASFDSFMPFDALSMFLARNRSPLVSSANATSCCPAA